MLYFERKFKRKGKNFIIGVDEAGRGPLAGPVVAAAVYLKTFNFKNRIDDSKKLTPHQREKAFFELIDKSIFGLGMVNEKAIDRLNILVATQIAMERAVEELLKKLPANKEADIQLLVDGNVKLKIPYLSHPISDSFVRCGINLSCTNIIKGDSRSKSIAAASILAKVSRDRIMYLYDKLLPQYGFAKHKGYPTKAHRIAIKRFGSSLIQRMSFSGV